MNTIQASLSAEKVELEQRVGIVDIIDEVIPRHWLYQGLSLGQLLLGWTTFILSQGDYRKVTVEDWAKDRQSILSECLGEAVYRTDFTDDRPGHGLTYLSDDKNWHSIEHKLCNLNFA